MSLPIREFSAAVRPPLEALGLRKRAGDYYTVELAHDMVGSIALGRATEHRVLEIWPMVGVRHQPTERLLSDLLDRTYHPYSPATIVSGLGYLMPGRHWKTWLIEEAAFAPSRAAEVAEAVRDYGLPGMHEYESVEAILRALSTGQVMTSPRAAYLGPVVLTLLGRLDEATEELARQLETRHHRIDPEADAYRRFASRLGSLQISGSIR